MGAQGHRAHHLRHRRLVVAALRAGASGFLLKGTPTPKIVEAVHRVLAGEPILSPSVTARLIASATDGQPTERRDDVLVHLAGRADRRATRTLAQEHKKS